VLNLCLHPWNQSSNASTPYLPLHFACDLHAYPKYRLQLEDDLFYFQQTLVGTRND
jgi:hypothetical protein